MYFDRGLYIIVYIVFDKIGVSVYCLFLFKIIGKCSNIVYNNVWFYMFLFYLWYYIVYFVFKWLILLFYF